MELDVDRIRDDFPALHDGTAYFDGPGGTQVPTSVAAAMAATMTAGISNRGRVTAAERRADEVVLAARRAVADLLGCQPGGVVFARSMTQATYDVSRALAREWGPGDEVVVTRLDHDANIRPWLQAAASRGAEVRWAGFDRATGELALDEIRSALTPRTRLVAMTAASNVLGTRPEVAAIAAEVHKVGAVLFVDGVHLTPHAPVDVGELGADFFSCSPYKFFGPHHGAVVADPRRWERLHPDKLLPASDAVPERFELGTLPYELLAGTTAAVDFIAGLVQGSGDRRARVLSAMRVVEAHEAGVFDRLREGLGSIPGVRVHGRPVRCTPTAFFTVEGHSGPAVAQRLASVGVNAPASHFYALEASRWLGLGDEGAVRAGVAPYTTVGEVDRLLAGVAAAAR